jgi:hypothetical protein
MKTIIFQMTLAAVLGATAFSQPVAPQDGTWTTLNQGPTFEWPVLPRLEPATGPVRKEQLLALLNAVDDNAWGSDINRILEFRFAPLSVGKVYLLVSEFCKSECGAIEAVYCQQNRCFSASISAIIDLKNDLVDLDGDGLFEIMGKECIHDCSGLPRLPTFVYSIYKFIDGKGFVDYSAQAADYYREHLLPKIEAAQNESTIEAKVAAMNAGLNEQRRQFAADRGVLFPPLRQVETYQAAARYASDDYRRRVLGERDAGLDNAVRWLESDNTRELGLQALIHIPDPRADAELLAGVKSKDSQLAEQAKSSLELRQELRARGLLK